MLTESERPWLTFDCYDTLVRYSESKAEALADMVRGKGGGDAAVAAAQAAFEESEKELQLGSFQLLNLVLRKSLHFALDAVGLDCAEGDEEIMIEAVKTAEPFPEVMETLSDLKRDHRLAILSNSEPDIIRHTTVRLGVALDAVVLAYHAECYKPAIGMFETLLQRIDVPPGEVTHIAQSFYHDMRTAKDVGIGRRLWINRYGREGDPAYTPDAELSDLSGVRGFLAAH